MSKNDENSPWGLISKEPVLDPVLSKICESYKQQLILLDNEINFDKSIEKNKNLAQLLCDLSEDSLAQIKETKIEHKTIISRLNTYKNEILPSLIEAPIRCALEFLDRHPNQAPALEALTESISFFAEILKEVYNLAVKAKKRNLCWDIDEKKKN